MKHLFAILLLITVSLSQSAIVNKFHKTSQVHVIGQNKFNDFDTYWTHDILIDLKILKINRTLRNSFLFSAGINSKWGSIENYSIIVNDDDVTDEIIVETSVTNSKDDEINYLNVDFDELESNDHVVISYTKKYHKNMDNISYHHFGSIPFPVSEEKLSLVVPSELYNFVDYEIHNEDELILSKIINDEYKPEIQESVLDDDENRKVKTYTFNFKSISLNSNKKEKKYLNSRIRDSFYVYYYKNNSSWLSAFNLKDYFTNFKQCLKDEISLDELHRDILRSSEYESYIENVYYYIQKNIQYAYVNLHDDGYLPATTKHVLEQKKADCKDYTTIMLKLFRRQGYEAYMVDINTYDNSTLDFRKDIKYLYQFNHAILYVNDGKKEYYLDATGEVHNVNDIRRDVEGMDALLINDLNDEIKAITIPEIKYENNISSIKFDGFIKNDSLIGIINYDLIGHISSWYRRRFKTNINDMKNYFSKSLKNKFENIIIDSIKIDKNYDIFKDTINYSVAMRIPNFIENIAGIKTHKLNFLEYVYSPFKSNTKKTNNTRLPYANLSKKAEYTIKYPKDLNVSYLPREQAIDNDIHQANFNVKFNNNTLSIKNKIIQKRRKLANEEITLAKENFKTIKEYLDEYVTF